MKHLIYCLPFILLACSNTANNECGCTDPQAKNFKEQVNCNDGSCKYEETNYLPEHTYFLPEEVYETSGLIFLNNHLYTFNDSDNKPILYRLDTIDGTVNQRITLFDVQNYDWEDIAYDDQYIYIGDFGNNAGMRKNLMIYRISRSDIPDEGDVSLSPEIIRFSYPDQKNFEERYVQHNHDCESMIIKGEQIILFSKNWDNEKCKWYTLSIIPGTQIAKLQGKFNSKGLITGADINKTGDQISLVGYNKGSWVPFMWILSDFDSTDVLSGNKRRIDFPQLPIRQMEAICYYEGNKLFISAEATETAKQQLFKLNTEIWFPITEK